MPRLSHLNHHWKRRAHWRGRLLATDPPKDTPADLNAIEALIEQLAPSIFHGTLRTQCGREVNHEAAVDHAFQACICRGFEKLDAPYIRVVMPEDATDEHGVYIGSTSKYRAGRFA